MWLYSGTTKFTRIVVEQNWIPIPFNSFKFKNGILCKWKFITQIQLYNSINKRKKKKRKATREHTEHVLLYNESTIQTVNLHAVNLCL